MKATVAHLAHRSLRYFESGGGRPVLLLHAFPLSADQWLPQLHRVPIGFRFVAPDLRGFRGMGAAFEDPGLGSLSIDDYAQDVLALATHLELDRFVVCGLSMGGYVAFALHTLAPGRVAGLILSNTRAGADTAEGRAGRDRMTALAREEGPEAVAREMVPRLLGETTRRDQPDLVDAVRRLIVVNSVDGIVSALGALKTRPDSKDRLGAIACPALIVTGDEDAIIPVSESEAMQRGIANASLVVLPKVGHLSNLEDPVRWSRAVEAGLNSM